jgi:hypothetical protein
MIVLAVPEGMGAVGIGVGLGMGITTAGGWGPCRSN